MAEVMWWRSLALLLTAATLVVAKYAELPAWRGAGRLSALEAEDETQDAALLAAVRDSVRQWELKRARTRSKRSQASVCYEGLGCFEDAGPFAYLETLPSPPREIDTHFLLYSTISRGDQPLLAVSASNVSAAWEWAARAFDSQKPTKVIVHGFGSNCDNVWVYEMRSALMAVEECNVVCVDWEGGAVMPNYLRAAANTRLVGKQLAMLLNGLAEHIHLKFQDVHLIGFSLGAHVAGFAGSEVGNISRITGLDPAGPLFEFQDARARLDSGDARFVDVIHSNGENLILGGLGAAQPLGHVDFYPNGGRVQHGCSNLFVGAVSDLVLPWAAPSPLEGRSLCNHRRAYKFFTDSVSPKCHFPAFPCATYDDFLEGRCFPCGGSRRCGNMGYYADRSLGRGQLYLLTREEEPFCAHQYHVTVWSGGAGAGGATSYGRMLITLHGDSGLNETFPMTKKEDAALVRGARLTRMVVPHPALGVPLRATMHYVAYSGWLSTGARAHIVDKLLIVYRKEDAALVRGARLTRMVVPHPALGVPLRATLHYVAYAGWLSTGARAHIVDKLLIADSFGKKSSFCKKGLELVSAEPVDLPLYPGDCRLPLEDDKNAGSNSTENVGDTSGNTTNSVPTAGAVDDPHQNEVAEDPPPRAFSLFGAAEILELPWAPADEALETGRAFGVTNLKAVAGGASEIAEPVLRPRPQKSPRRTSETQREISEPLLRATVAPTPRPTSTPLPVASRRPKNYNSAKDKDGEASSAMFQLMSYGEKPKTEESGFVVQFLPTRLASFITRAERYARDTLLPLVSAYAPRLPLFGAREVPKPEARYIPTEEMKSGGAPPPTPTLESKISMLKSMGPPGPPEAPVETSEASQMADRVLVSEKKPPSTDAPPVEPVASKVGSQDPIEIVAAPDASTTALPPVAVRGGDTERLLIVYPSNARDDRKIRSHSYSEIAQFEALYRRTASPREVRVELPTYRPQPPAEPATSAPDNKFIPVSYPNNLVIGLPINSTKV